VWADQQLKHLRRIRSSCAGAAPSALQGFCKPSACHMLWIDCGGACHARASAPFEPFSHTLRRWEQRMQICCPRDPERAVALDWCSGRFEPFDWVTPSAPDRGEEPRTRHVSMRRAAGRRLRRRSQRGALRPAPDPGLLVARFRLGEQCSRCKNLVARELWTQSSATKCASLFFHLLDGYVRRRRADCNHDNQSITVLEN